MSRNSSLAKPWLSAAAVLWLALVALGSRSLLNFANAPGASGSPPDEWPVASAFYRARNAFTLVVTLHPRCSCSFATLSELRVFLQRAPQPVVTYLIFHREGALRSAVTNTGLWQDASSISGATLIVDDGTEAAIFGANTSGQAMLYGPDGRLRFKGGITFARGHEGDNFGLDALLAAMKDGAFIHAVAPVFGCPLHDPSVAGLQKDTSWTKR
jgi:hypothetical protein